jgi:hypothetical protein
MAYLDELQALTEQREALNERVREQYERRGLPSHIPLAAIGGKDPELETLAADWQAYNERWAAFTERYYQGGVDPHTID